MSRFDRGLTLLEVLIAVVLLGMVSGFLVHARVDALRHGLEQRRHVELTQLLRSEAEALRAGALHIGLCASLTPEQIELGWTCLVADTCAFPPAICSAAPGLRTRRIEASGPSGRTAELALIVRPDPDRWIEARR